MNQTQALTTTPPVGAISNRAGGAKAIIAGVKRAAEPYEALSAALDETSAETSREWRQRARAMTAIHSERADTLDKMRLRHPEFANQHCDALQAWIEQAPNTADLARLLQAYEVSAIPAVANQVRSVVSLMVDAFPNARPHAPEVYFEVLVDQVVSGQFSVGEVARAYQAILTKSKFPPSAAEFVEACSTASKEGKAMATWASQCCRAVVKAQAALDDARRLGPLVRTEAGIVDPSDPNGGRVG